MAGRFGHEMLAIEQLREFLATNLEPESQRKAHRCIPDSVGALWRGSIRMDSSTSAQSEMEWSKLNHVTMAQQGETRYTGKHHLTALQEGSPAVPSSMVVSES